MATDQITTLAYTAREINRTWTRMENFNFVLLSEMGEKERVELSLSCFDSVEHAYAYNTEATGSLGKSHSCRHSEYKS